MTTLLLPFLSGAFGGVCSWWILEFVQKPYRAFFDLKKESIEILTRYANVQARATQVSLDADRIAHHLGEAVEKRLQDAEDALRGCGSKFISFAETETLATRLLRLRGYDPAELGQQFIGLSNSIGEFGSHRAHYSKKVNLFLKRKM